MRAKSKKPSKLPTTALVLAIISVVLALITGPGYRLGLWGLDLALLGLLPLSLLCSLIAVFMSIEGAIRGIKSALGGLVLSMLVLGFLGTWTITALSVPAIHDITTDDENVPEFVGLLDEREASPIGAAYEGPEAARLQHEAYPDIHPLILPISVEEAFAKALEVVKALGWDIAAANATTGHIEASYHNFYFGFTDDIIIRIRSNPQGSRIDLRSVSRVRKSDLGLNADHIRDFMEAMQSRVAED